MPAQPKLAGKAASEVRFPTWDELVAEAQGPNPVTPYRIPFSEDEVIEIPVPDGARYLDIVDAQRRGDVVALMEALFPDRKVRAKMQTKLKGAPFEIVDLIGAKAMRHFYGLNIETEEKSGNSPAS